jgi:hypothetical protein
MIEPREFRGDSAPARNLRIARHVTKPSRELLNKTLYIAFVRVNVLPSDIGHKCLLTMLFPVENESPLALVAPASTPLRSKEKAEFERHVETRQARLLIEARHGDIVDAIAALGNYCADFFEADLSTLVVLERAARREARAQNRKNDSVEECLIIRGKGTV